MPKLGQSQAEGPLPFEGPDSLVEASESELSKPKPNQVVSGQPANGGVVAPQMNGPWKLAIHGHDNQGDAQRCEPM